MERYETRGKEEGVDIRWRCIRSLASHKDLYRMVRLNSVRALAIWRDRTMSLCFKSDQHDERRRPNNILFVALRMPNEY